jgi:hypothetical protein
MVFPLYVERGVITTSIIENEIKHKGEFFVNENEETSHTIYCWNAPAITSFSYFHFKHRQ